MTSWPNVHHGASDDYFKKLAEEAERKKNEVPVETRFVKSFVKQKLGERANKVKFIQDIMSAWGISTALKNDLESYWAGLTEFDTLDKTFYDSVHIEKLKREVKAAFIELESKRDNIREIFFSEYKINPDKYDKEIWDQIEKLSEKELEDLLNSENARKKFLQKQYWTKEKMPEKRDFNLSLEKLNFPDRVEKKLKKLKESLEKEKKKPIKNQDKIDELEENISDIENLANRFSITKKMDTVDIKTLFEVDFFENDEKREMVHTFLPSISLYEAQKLWIVTKVQADKHKYNFVKYKFFDNDSSVSNSEILAIANKLDEKNVTISTKNYAIDESHINNILEEKNLAYKIAWNISWDLKKWVEDLEKAKKQKELEKYGQSVEKFKEDLGKTGKLKDIKDLENFTSKNKNGKPLLNWERNVVVLNIRESFGKTETGKGHVDTKLFWDIKDDWDGNWMPKFISKWEENYNSDNQFFERGYSSLLNFIQSWNETKWVSVNKIEILTQEQLRNRIETKQIKEVNGDLHLLNKDDEEKQAKLLKEKEEELKKQGLSEEQINNNLEYKNIAEKLDNIDEYNRRTLEQKISEEDPEWNNFWFDDWTTFETKEGSIYTISIINPQSKTIQISSRWTLQPPISFENFFYTFKKLGCKRTSKATNFIEVFESAKASDSGWWSDFELKSWKHIQKKNTEKDINYPYLVSKSDDQVLKLEKVDGNLVKVRYWEYEQKDIKKWDKKVWTDKKYKMLDRTVWINYWELDTYIKKWKLKPESVDEDKDIPKVKDVAMKWSFLSKIFSNMSIWEIISWWKMWLDSIENYLKEWNEENAAKFASGVLWKLLPPELRKDLKSRVEDAWKKRMEDYVKKLWQVDSWIATDWIKSWLKNSDCPEYKKEAAVIFMMEKYWSLYAKTLNEEKWTLLWYKALWWTPYDDFHKDLIKKHDDMDVNLTEEDLVFMFVKAQCKEKGYNWIKRRSRLHKELKAKRNNAKEDEWNKWQKDAGNEENTRMKSYKYAVWELKWGTPVNGMGAVETMISKWWPFNNYVTYLIALTTAKDLDQDSLDKYKGYIKKVSPVSALMTKKSHLEILLQTILEVSKDISKLHPEKYGKMWEKAQKIYENMDSLTMKYPNKVDEVSKFLETYWEPLDKALNMLHSKDASKETNINKIIYLRKDKHYDPRTWEELEWKSIYKQYYNLFTESVDTMMTYKETDMLNDSWRDHWTTWIDVKKATVETLLQTQWWWFREWVWNDSWREINRELRKYTKKNIYRMKPRKRWRSKTKTYNGYT